MLNVLQQRKVVTALLPLKEGEEGLAVLLVVHADRIGRLLKISVVFSGRHAGLHRNLLKDQLCIQLCDIFVLGRHRNALPGKAFSAQHHSIAERLFVSSNQSFVVADLTFDLGCECHPGDLLKILFYSFFFSISLWLVITRNPCWCRCWESSRAMVTERCFPPVQPTAITSWLFFSSWRYSGII